MTSATLLALCLSIAVPAVSQDMDARTRRLVDDVQRELISLPNYGVFDNLVFAVEKGGVVRLLGQVVRPTLKDDAERKVKRVSGVETVINEIEVLPTSRVDDAIRLAVARAIYSTNGLDLYALQSNPPIHIIVKNARVTLEGAVDNEGDKTIAGLKAREVTGVFEVKNNLRAGPGR